MKVVVIKECSAGNESVGEMWKETKIFEPDQPIQDILDWGFKTWQAGTKPYYNRRSDITITIADDTTSN